VTVDQRGRRAASELDQHVRQRVDPIVSLGRLSETRDERVPPRRRPTSVAVAFAAVIAVVVVLVVAFGVLSSDTGIGPASKATYAFAPAAPPRGMHLTARLEAPNGVRYLADHGARKSLSVITTRGAGTQLDPRGADVEVRGHPAKLLHGLLADLRIGEPTPELSFAPVPRAVVWQEAGFTIDVRSVGLSTDELMRAARTVRRSNQAHFRDLTSGLPVQAGSDPVTQFLPGARPLFADEQILATFDQTEGPGLLSLGTVRYQGLRWLCFALIDQETRDAPELQPPPPGSTGTNVGHGLDPGAPFASSSRCVAPKAGFAFPLFVDDAPRVSFVLGSFPKSVRSVVVTRDNGEQLTAMLHDTGIGANPVVAFLNLGVRPPNPQPDATVVVTDKTGKITRRERIAS
jgi:hypothetical protein